MSGVILVVIVGMWAALLVPMWLRRHEEADQLGSIDRFSAAMRILSRQDRAMGSRAVVVPRRVDPADPAPERTVASHYPIVSPVSVTASRARLLARRRRVMAVLAGLAALTFLLAVVGVLSFWWQGVVDLTLVAYVAHLRAEAVRAQELRDARAGRSADAAADVPTWSTYSAAAVVGGGAALAPHVAAEVFAQPGIEPGWEPTPVPLPTYVTAPVAPRPAVRILDDDLGIEVFVDEAEVEEIVTRRRAVNE